MVCVQCTVQSETVNGVLSAQCRVRLLVCVYSAECRVRLLMVYVQCIVQSQSLTLHCALYIHQ